MSKILVTGAAGFIGSHLVEQLLESGHEVVGIDNFDDYYSQSIKEKNLSIAKKNKKFEFLSIDINNKLNFSRINKGIDVVIHLAAKAGVRPSIEAPEKYLETNIQGTQNLLQWMQEKGIKKLLFASSSSVYGNNKKIPFSEIDNVDFPISPYAYTKKACELLVHTFHHLYKIDAICLRFFTVYGPRQRPDLAIHKFVRLISNGEPITMFGDGTTSRDYTFVSDTVGGIESALNYLVLHSEVYEIINLGNNKPVQLKDLIEMIGIALEKEIVVNKIGMQPGDVDVTYADISKAQKLLNYHPKTEMQNGLIEFVKWYRSTHE